MNHDTRPDHRNSGAILVPPWMISWRDCSPNCPPPDVGRGKLFDPAKIP